MKSFLTILLTFFLGLTVFATAQYPDKIVYNGIKYDLFSNPLESYFDKSPDKRPTGGIMSTALWRGYVATFEIKDNQLFLKDIEIQISDTTKIESMGLSWKSVFNEVFPNQNYVKIDWLTELLVIPHGKLVNSIHMGYGSTYKRYILLEIDKGDLTKEKQFKYREYKKFKEKQFKAYKQTEEYIKLKSDLQKKGSSDKFIDSFLRSYVTTYTSKILVK